MNDLLKKANVSLKRGTVIYGKWNKQRYVVLRLLGIGAVGTVYLCRKQTTNEQVALKISEQPLAMTSEVKVLKALQKVQGTRLGPCLLDVDDWETSAGTRYAFYVMEYIRGVSLRTFIQQNGSQWIGVLLLQMLEQLENLHQAGYAFGDLKNDNIIVTSNPPLVHFIDVGGVTKFGRSIKEYTNFHDRAYWHLGKRIAEPSYDLFALAMIILAIYYPRTFKRTNNARELIKRKMLQIAPLKPYYRCLLKALDGRYQTARQMHQDLLQLMVMQKRGKNDRGGTYIIEACLLLFPTGLFYALYYFLS